MDDVTKSGKFFISKANNKKICFSAEIFLLVLEIFSAYFVRFDEKTQFISFF